jgi:hypothetical protein
VRWRNISAFGELVDGAERLPLTWSRKMSEHTLEVKGAASVLQKLKAEVLSVLPAVVFFFLALNLINIQSRAVVS